ncbi:tetratricopeptide repeat protein [Parvibaculum sp.]|jgi:tetratricopeptide (TPR) repeat protein|uniref:tetratricopeptide repeat protein n=1 Tax=Parvibaculum sp. TaxID=2024848 RepID=UPI000C42A022|nr:tetratricopeptide repeat protein [Parvibaculum sp.]MAM94106.1 hypothetical protein [Parvibaculum sp.]|tara:strand:- start:11332 stop:12954 length:1623 start_codon:yes stop_codon:yes gene_type:complete
MSGLSKRRIAEDSEIEKKFAQGQRLQSRDRFADAEARYRKVLAADPAHIGALTGICQCLIAQERAPEAIELLDHAAETIPADPASLFELGTACTVIGYRHQARAVYRRALELNPDHTSVLINLANVENDLGETQNAVDLLSRAIEVNPNAARAYSNLGKILTGTSLVEEALSCYLRAIEIDPRISQTWTNLAALYEIMGRFEDALEALRRSLTLNPECDAARWNLARTLLTLGQVEAGWDMYGFGFACRERKPYRPFPGLIWAGEDIKDKTIMVWREQGLGDDLIFSTCYSDLIARAGHVIIETDARLVPLYQRTWPQATVRAETLASTGLGNYGEVDFDLTAPAGLVAAQLRRNLDAFPDHIEGLQPDPERVAACRDWLATLGPGPKVGIAWTSAKVNDLRAPNYTALADWIPLFKAQNVSVVNLQYTNVDEEAEALAREHGLTLHRMPDLDLFGDLEGAAALTACMDAVVGPSSFPLMLGSALGRPCFHYGQARIWTKLGTDGLPWFPTMRCYTIDRSTDRAALAARITGDVTKFLAG